MVENSPPGSKAPNVTMAALCTCVMAWSKVTGICLNSASIDAVNFVSVRARSSLSAVSSPCSAIARRSEEHTSEPVTNAHLVCRLLLEKKKTKTQHNTYHTHVHTNNNTS